jgi:hypothetical protein
MVNRDKLRTELAARRIAPRAFSLEGGSPSERYCLERSAGGWAVYYSERGERTSERWFKTEDEACAYFLKWISQDPTAHYGDQTAP